MTLPQGFIDQMRSLLGDDSESFFMAMDKPPVVSVRLNSRKPGAEFAEGRRVKWCSTGYYLPSRPVFTLDPLLHAGGYYVQDASSMIFHEVVRRISGILDGESGTLRTPLSVLDLCAAPGGKTTAMIDAVSDGSRVVANEYVAKRAGILRENIAKWGYPNVRVTNRDSSVFAERGDSFDIVAVDAPCSGEGMMRKDKVAVEQWSRQLVERCAVLQREILRNAAECVRPGGFLIYSTCTFNRVENEENAGFIRDVLGLLPEDMRFPEDWGILPGISTSLPVYRFMPHKTEGEGLFLAVFRKPGDWVAERMPPGVGRVTEKAGDVPQTEDILSVDFQADRYPSAELTLQQAISYLRRESIILDPEIPRGHVVVRYKGLALGLVKNIGTRANNLYPKNWRILMQ